MGVAFVLCCRLSLQVYEVYIYTVNDVFYKTAD
jgi:hypothetical protein